MLQEVQVQLSRHLFVCFNVYVTRVYLVNKKGLT